MKKLLFIGLLLAAPSFMFAQEQTKKNLAIVNEVDGYYVFVACKPVAAYEEMGKYDAGFTINGEPDELYTKIIKKLKRDYPKADAVIIESANLKKAIAIRWK